MQQEIAIPKVLADLGYDKVQAALASHCHSDRGKEEAFKFFPIADKAELTKRRNLHTQGRRLVEKAGRPDLGGADLRDILEDIARGEQDIDPRDLLHIAHAEKLIKSLLPLLEHLDPEQDRELWDRFDTLVDHSNLAARIEQAIAPDGSIKDEASVTLARLRRELGQSRHKLQTDLLQYIRSNQDLAQESLVTERNGRFVVPIKADSRGRVEGLVHDYSSSHRTAFMEPTSFVKDNNRVQELMGEEREEVARILSELISHVRRALKTLQTNQEIVAALDVVFASVNLASRQRAELCPIGERLELNGARHPLLAREKCVPVRLVMEPPRQLLLISGPNGGGKTVALKTLGLLALMHQAGLAIPTEENSSLPLFQRIASDIGDPQQLGSDSTFTGHLRAYKGFLSDAGPGWLVLLDELGSGTDPEEGGALGEAVLEALNEKGAILISTTHLLRIKTFAHRQPWAQLAATELDPETHEPTFRLVYGVPGRSSALQIAENLDFPAAVLSKARSRLQRGQLEFEELVRELEQARKDLREAEARAEREKDQAALVKRQYEAKRSQGFTEGLHQFQDETRVLMVKLRDLAHRQAGEVSKGEVRKIERQMSELASRGQPTRLQLHLKPEEKIEPDRKLKIGDRAHVVPLGIRGEVLDIDERKGTASVQGPKFALTVSLQDLEWMSSPKQEKASLVAQEFFPEKTARLELDLRGVRVEEGLEQVEGYLSDASLSGMPFVRIIHGMGTGRLRTAIQERLKKHSLVVSYRDGGENEGGLGVTVVKLTE